MRVQHSLIYLFFLQASLNAGLDLKNAVSLPDDEEINDWVAVHGKCACVYVILELHHHDIILYKEDVVVIRYIVYVTEALQFSLNR